MKHRSRALAAITLIVVVTCAAMADPMPKSLRAAYANVDRAIGRLDFKAFAAHFDPNFVLFDPNMKPTSRPEFLAMVKPMFAEFRMAKANTKILSVNILGEHAEVKYILNIEMKGKPGKMTMREEGTDSLILKNGKWMLYKTVQDRFSMSGPN